MGQLINGRLVYPRERLITHLQQRLTRGGGWWGRCTNQRRNSRNDYRRVAGPRGGGVMADSLTLIREGGGAPGAEDGGPARRELNKDGSTGVKVNLGAEGTLAGRCMLLAAVNAMIQA